MVTVGLIKELFFISSVLKTDVDFVFNLKYPLIIKVSQGILELYYKDCFIWRERIEGDTSFFGIESCDNISRVLACLDNNDSNWQKYCYIE